MEENSALLRPLLLSAPLLSTSRLSFFYKFCSPLRITYTYQAKMLRADFSTMGTVGGTIIQFPDDGGKRFYSIYYVRMPIKVPIFFPFQYINK